MNKLILLSAVLALEVQSFAAGVVGNDQPQSGVIFITNAGSVGRFTNSFPYQYTQRPVLVLSGSAGPYTINSVTTTNFDVTTTSTNNTSINWSAYLGYARIQSGQVITVGDTTTNIAFAFTYAYPPIVTLSGRSTNALTMPAVVGVTTTNFSLLSNVAGTNQWVSIGESYAPGNQPVTY